MDAADAAAKPPAGVTRHPLLGRGKQPNPISSPTDSIMSPTTQKLEEKRKHWLAKAKPRSLASAFAAATSDDKPGDADQDDDGVEHGESG